MVDSDPCGTVEVLVLFARIEDATHVSLSAAPKDAAKGQRLAGGRRRAMPKVVLAGAGHVNALPPRRQPKDQTSLAFVLLLEAENARLEILLEPTLGVVRRERVDDTLHAGDDERLSIGARELTRPGLRQREERTNR